MVLFLQHREQNKKLTALSAFHGVVSLIFPFGEPKRRQHRKQNINAPHPNYDPFHNPPLREP